MQLQCPVCRQRLCREEKILRCENNHCFDRAKEGYFNLHTGIKKPGSAVGDNRTVAKARNAFLSKGYFETLLNAVDAVLCECCSDGAGVLDICCGEGYYSASLKQRHPNISFYGFDISKEMVRLAAKRKSGNEYYVANLMKIPIADNSIDMAFHLFAPFCEKEFMRVLKPGGVLVSAVAGENHLWQMKEILYDEPYKNDEKPPLTVLPFSERRRADGQISLHSKEDIRSLFNMTPYYFHTPTEGMNRLEACNELTTDISFALYIYRKPE